MIFDELSNLERYADVHPRFGTAFAFLREMIVKTPTPGRYVCPDDAGVIVNVFEYDTKPMGDDVQMEAHRDYIDVQVVLIGEENMYVPAVKDLAVTVPYDAEKDIEFFKMPDPAYAVKTTVQNGYFAVFFANELHAPGISMIDRPTRVRKFVVKVRD